MLFPSATGSGNEQTTSASRICPSALTNCSFVDDPEPSTRKAFSVPPATATASSFDSSPTPITKVAMEGEPVRAFFATCSTLSSVEAHTFGSSSVASSTATARSGLSLAQPCVNAYAPCNAGSVGVSPPGFCLPSLSLSAAALPGNGPTGTAGTP